MSKLISSPFLFDSEVVRDACVVALGLDDYINTSVLEVTQPNLILTPQDHTNKIILFNVDYPEVGVITIQPEDASPWNEKSKITIIKTGTANTSFVPYDITINSPESLEIRKRYSIVQLIRLEADVWAIAGDLKTEDPYLLGVDTPVPLSNGTLSYYDGNNTVAADDGNPIENISIIGGKISLTDSNLITIPYDFAGAPVEMQIDGITPVKDSFPSDLSFKINSDNAIISQTGINMTIGIGPFKLGEARFFTYSIVVTENDTTANTIDVVFKKNGTTLATHVAKPRTSSFGFEYITADNDLKFILQYGTTTDAFTTTVESNPWPLFTRILFDSIAANTAFRIDYTAALNGMGQYVPVRLNTNSGIFEVKGNIIEPIS
jgi:hypothetical protein